MSVWMEIRCERRNECNDHPSTDKSCWSYRNAGPMEMASDNLSSIARVWKLLCEDAEKSGWKRTRAGWVCPNHEAVT